MAENWRRWGPGLGGAEVAIDYYDSVAVFSTVDCKFYLHQDESGWVVDMVGDRSSLRNCEAKLLTFDLAEKYLIWDWITAARSDLSSGRLGADLYKQGYAPGIEVTELNGTHAQLYRGQECAILILGTAKIFSHIMLMSIDELELAAETSGR